MNRNNVITTKHVKLTSKASITKACLNYTGKLRLFINPLNGLVFDESTNINTQDYERNYKH